MRNVQPKYVDDKPLQMSDITIVSSVFRTRLW